MFDSFKKIKQESATSPYQPLTCFLILSISLFTNIEIQFTCHKVLPFKLQSSLVFIIFIQLYNHHHNLILEYFHHHSKPRMRQQSLPILHFPGPQVTINQLSVSGDLSVLHMSYKGIIEQVVFQIWLLSLSIVVSQFICITACISAWFFIAK